MIDIEIIKEKENGVFASFNKNAKPSPTDTFTFDHFLSSLSFLLLYEMIILRRMHVRTLQKTWDRVFMVGRKEEIFSSLGHI